MNKFIKNIYENKHIILIFVFSIISALCLFMKGDDFIWYYVSEVPKLEAYKVPNGRYFSNFITEALLKIPILKNIFYVFVLSFMIILMGKIIDFGNKNFKIGAIFSFCLILFLPSGSFAEAINWFSGFTNYSFSFLLTSAYIIFVFKIAFDEYVPKNYLCPIMLVFAFLSGLCVEHISIYNIVFSIFAIFLIKYKKKKIYPANICYTIGAVCGFVLMLSNNMYSDILKEGDDIGQRGFSFSFSDIYMNLFKYLQPNYINPFWIINLIITISLLIIYFNAVNNEKKYKYGKICILICIGFTAYSIITSCFSPIQSFTGAMKIRGVETAFTFIYLVSIVYLVVKLLDKDKAIRCIMYLLSTLLTALPFIILAPITPRCMFVNYMFWILLGGELFITAFNKFAFSKSNMFKDLIFVLALVPAIIISGFNISNCYYENIRYEFIKQQLDEGKTAISIIKTPYTKYSYDFIDIDKMFKATLSDDNSYGEYIFKYYGLECLNNEDYDFYSITCYDYNTLMES